MSKKNDIYTCEIINKMLSLNYKKSETIRRVFYEKICYGIIATLLLGKILFVGMRVNQSVATKMADSLSVKIVKFGNLRNTP